MPEVDILVPLETKNYIENPSFEEGTDGWNAVGSAISSVLTRARFERKSLQVVTTGAGLHEGTYYRISDTSLKGVIYGSLYVRGAGKLRLRLISGASQTVSRSIDIHDNYWQRLNIQGIANGLDDLRIYIETAETSQAVTFYIDGVQVERTDYLTSYCDGEQTDCFWTGVSHASTSKRNGNTPNGGRWVNIRDDECNPSTYITTFSGFGLPPITINRQRMALSPGAYFDSERVEERVIQLGVSIKDDYAQRRSGLSKIRMNTLRQHLIDLIKPDRNKNTEPMWMRYRDGDRSVMIRVLYESGLDFEGDFRNKWINQIPLRFLALDPFWYEDSQETVLLDTENTIPEANALASRQNGEWVSFTQDLEKGVPNFRIPDAVYVIVEDKNGRIYIGGQFTNDSNGLALRNIGVVSDDYTVLSEIKTGLNDSVSDIVAHPNGKMYFCGYFTGDNDGNTYNRIVEYDYDADTFTALGTGLDGSAFDMDIDKNGNVYVVGTFTDANGVAIPDSIAKWDGGTFERIGDLQTDLSVTIIRVSNIISITENDIYVGGNFNHASDDIYLAHWDGTTWSASIRDSDAPDSPCDKIILLDNGNIIFTGSNSDGNNGEIGEYNGSSYSKLGDLTYPNLGNPFARGSFDDYTIVKAAAKDKRGNVYFAGRFDSVGGISVSNNLVGWNGNSFFLTDFQTDVYATAILIKDDGSFYLGFPLEKAIAVPIPLNIQAGGITEIICKSTASTFPILSFTGTGRVLWLENQSSEQVSYFDYTIQEDEELEVDFRRGVNSVLSNYKGSVPDAILPNSDNIFLLPSSEAEEITNKISLLITDEVSPVVQLRYQPTHWSVDAISKQ